MRIGFLLILAAVWPVSVLAGDAVPWPTKVLHRVPRSEKEVADAHEQNKATSALTLEAGEPISVPLFSREISYTINGDTSNKVTVQAGRRPFLTFGMAMNADDQKELPWLSGGKILEHVNGTYLTVEARIERMKDGGEPFLHYRPVAGACTFDDREQTEELATMLLEAVNEVRSLGMFVKQGETLSAENLRTLVAVYRYVPKQSKPADAPPGPPRPLYELLFLRARMSGTGDAPKVDLHAFASNSARDRIFYLRPYALPTSADECSIKSMIYFTQYSFGGLYPTASETRETEVHDRRSFSLASLDKYAKKAGWKGDALDNLTELLDAIIDGHVDGDPPAVSAAP